MASSKPVPDARFVLSHPFHLLAFGLGSGLTPIAPGTAGTLMAVPLYLAMQSLPLSVYLTLTGLMLSAGFWICAYTSRALCVHDHEGIVWDEIVGYLITMFMAPEGWFWVVLGFGLFRVFDILKPWPVGWFDQNVKGGIGIMSDDVIAAVYAAMALQLVAYSMT
jgi:phosphatidylglycerophosphatase A